MTYCTDEGDKCRISCEVLQCCETSFVGYEFLNVAFSSSEIHYSLWPCSLL